MDVPPVYDFDLFEIAESTRKDLEVYEESVLREMLLYVISQRYNQECPEKYRCYKPKPLPKIKHDLIESLVSPIYLESSKSKLIQGSILRQLLNTELSDENARQALIDFGWLMDRDTIGTKLEDWSFNKVVTEKHLNSQLSGNARGKGNPFTIFKIDNAEMACREMWVNDLQLVYKIADDGSRVMGFRKGFDAAFVSFDSSRERRIIPYNSSNSQSKVYSHMSVVGESTAEGFNFGLAWFLFEEEIVEFLEIPPDSTYFLVGAHRRQHRIVGQVEIDAVIHWSTNTKQGRFIVENKGGRTIKKNANGSFSKHQLLRPHSIVSDAISSHKLPCEVKTLYCRFSRSNNQGCWDIDLDLYGVSKDQEIYWEKGLSLINIPSS